MRFSQTEETTPVGVVRESEHPDNHKGKHEDCARAGILQHRMPERFWGIWRKEKGWFVRPKGKKGVISGIDGR